MTNRRRFLQGAAGAAGLMGLHAAGLLSSTASAASAASARIVEPASEKLRILVLGGTGFIGPHEIDHALARGHRVTMFNRGNRSGLYGDRVEELQGDRDTDKGDGLTALQGDRTWDVVIDNSGYVPRHVRDAVELLGSRCSRYVYVSTVAAYEDGVGGHLDENGPLATLDDPAVEQVTGETYGPLKADCDRIVRQALGTKATVVRPTFIIGPGDRTDRFTYWADRIHRGGDVVGPANREVAVQAVDVRDLCPWLVTLAENDTPGAFNAAASAYTREGFLWAVRGTTGREVAFHWPDAALVDELEFPAPMLNWGTVSQTYDNAASRAAGLDYRPLADSTLATLEWWNAQPDERRANPRGWPSAELERQVLERMG